MHNHVKIILDKLGLESHIEGGYYKQTYKSPHQIKNRSINTAIYYLLESNDFSSWHRLKSDEIWYYHFGSPLMLYQIDPQGTLTSTVLGNFLENSDAEFQCIIPAGNWFSAEVNATESFTLVSCSVAPGFEYEDFEIGKRDFLLQQFPKHKQLIVKLTRES